jgi:hypothetical protein
MAKHDGRVVSNFIVQALKGEDITIYGDGLQTRSFCYISDLIAGATSFLFHNVAIKTPINLGNDDEFFIDISKEKKFLKNKSIQFRYYTIFKPLLDLIENFNVTIIFFKDRSESKNFFNLPNEQKYPSSAEDGSLIEFKSKYIELTNFKKKHGYIPSLKAPESYLEIVNLFLKNKNILHKKIVTISLRVCSYGLERNSIIKNWIEIYEWLKNKNYQPVFINDLENLDSFSNFKFEEKYLTFDIATTDCRARLAIYENSFFHKNL